MLLSGSKVKYVQADEGVCLRAFDESVLKISLRKRLVNCKQDVRMIFPLDGERILRSPTKEPYIKKLNMRNHANPFGSGS
jgi:hypothetical protein